MHMFAYLVALLLFLKFYIKSSAFQVFQHAISLANKIGYMKRRTLTPEEKADALRLNDAWKAYQKEHKGATQAWLAAEANLGTQGAVGQYLRGVIPLNLVSLLKFCKVIGADPKQISPRLTNFVSVMKIALESATEDAEQELRRLHDDIPGSFRANHNRFRKIPAYGKAMGGMPDRIWDEDGGYPVGASDVYAEVASADPNAFLVPVEGTSMSPRFNPGEYALVEPNTEPELEDDVLVRLGDGRTMIKRLLSRRGAVRLGSYNSQEIISAPPEEIVWMYYVAHPVPARKIKNRI